MEIIQDLIAKKQTTRDKLSIEVDNAKDSVRRAQNKLMDKESAFALREYELDKLKEILETMVSFEGPMKELSDAFKEIMGMSIEDWQTMAQADMRSAPQFIGESVNIIGAYNEFKKEIVRLEAGARKIYYNR